MAVWGTPVAREDDAERTVRAALELVDAVAALGGRVGAPDLRARAGIVTGQAALLNRDEGLVVGDRVNTAARIQGAADPGTVFVDDVTRQVTSPVIAYEDAGRHALKGKSEPLQLWRAVELLAAAPDADRDGLQAQFVGRDAELRLIKELFHAAVSRSSARLVAVSGAAGVGKSRLRSEFLDYLTEAAGSVPLAPRPLPPVWRRRRLLGARRDGPTSARNPGGRPRRGGRAKARTPASSAGSATRASASSSRLGSGSCWASPRPAQDATSCSPVGGCSSSGWPSSIPW